MKSVEGRQCSAGRDCLAWDNPASVMPPWQTNGNPSPLISSTNGTVQVSTIRDPGETQGPGSKAWCELMDSQLYQRQKEKYGSCDDDCF